MRVLTGWKTMECIGTITAVGAERHFRSSSQVGVHAGAMTLNRIHLSSSGGPMELFVVTGGSKGIGRAVADAVAQESGRYQLITISRAPTVACPGLHIAADLATPEGVESAVKRILEFDRPVGVLVNNAGAILDENPLSEVSVDALSKSMYLHCFGPLLLANGIRPRLEEAQKPCIVNIGSIYGGIADIDVPAYVLSKSPIPLLTSLMARAYAPKIRVNCILPGHVNTSMTQSAPCEFVDAIVDRTPARRLGNPSEISDLVMYLVSDASSFINGAVVRADGGFWSSLG